MGVEEEGEGRKKEEKKFGNLNPLSIFFLNFIIIGVLPASMSG